MNEFENCSDSLSDWSGSITPPILNSEDDDETEVPQSQCVVAPSSKKFIRKGLAKAFLSDAVEKPVTKDADTGLMC